MPAVRSIIETALYVDDLDRAASYYAALFEFETLFSDDRLVAFNVGDRHVLLLFKRGASLHPAELPGGTIPPHDGHGPVHIAFAVDPEALAGWEAALRAHGIPVESRMTWPMGGVSLYFRDPDRHLVEILTPGVWTVY